MLRTKSKSAGWKHLTLWGERNLFHDTKVQNEEKESWVIRDWGEKMYLANMFKNKSLLQNIKTDSRRMSTIENSVKRQKIKIERKMCSREYFINSNFSDWTKSFRQSENATWSNRNNRDLLDVAKREYFIRRDAHNGREGPWARDLSYRDTSSGIIHRHSRHTTPKKNLLTGR